MEEPESQLMEARGAGSEAGTYLMFLEHSEKWKKEDKAGK